MARSSSHFPKNIREDLNLSQQEFANLLGVNHITVFKWENEKYKNKPKGRPLSYIRLFDKTFTKIGDINKFPPIKETLDQKGPLWTIYEIQKASMDYPSP
jgi:DNA-binding XRE family transcriptional regulator